jgi:hypothetical protein
MEGGYGWAHGAPARPGQRARVCGVKLTCEANVLRAAERLRNVLGETQQPARALHAIAKAIGRVATAPFCQDIACSRLRASGQVLVAGA